jgi:hypothetical protein
MQERRHIFGKYRSAISPAILFITAFCLTSPLIFHGGVPGRGDMVFHLFQSEQFSMALHEGTLFPRWLCDYNNGYGSPVSVFYAPLSYYFVSLIHLFVPSLVMSMVIGVWSAFFLSGMTMFIAAKRLFGNGSLLAAILYQTLPFHVSDFYVRGNFAEFLAFAWLPLIFLYLNDPQESRRRKWPVSAKLSLSYAGLILTHLVSGFIFSLAAGLYAVYQYFSGDGKKIVKTVSSLALGLGLASFYLIPLVYERKFVHIDYIVNSVVGDYENNFLFTWDKFQAGLGGFYIPLQVGVVLEVLLFVITVKALYGRRQALPKRGGAFFFVLFFLFAFYLTTPLSGFVWRILPGFPILQFPWRWVQVMELSLSFLVAGVLSGGNRPHIRWSEPEERWIVFLMVTLSLASLLIISTSRIPDKESLYENIGPDAVSRNMAVGIEYTPVWTNDLDKVFLEKTSKVSVLSGVAVTGINEWKCDKRVVEVRASTPSVLRVSTFYYPGWKARLDGTLLPVATEKDTGAMLIDTPAGSHILTLTFENTPLRRFSWVLSFCSFLVLALSCRPGLKPRCWRDVSSPDS